MAYAKRHKKAREMKLRPTEKNASFQFFLKKRMSRY